MLRFSGGAQRQPLNRLLAPRLSKYDGRSTLAALVATDDFKPNC